MKLVQCPATLPPVTRGVARRTLFLAGGITNCFDWQAYAIEQLKDENDGLVLINPRRDDFDVNDPDASSFQIEWEYEHLIRCDAYIFWFPCETLCPITLFELGKAVMGPSPQPLFVGCHPEYARKFDVEKQLSLAAPYVVVRGDLDAVIDDARYWYTTWGQYGL